MGALVACSANPEAGLQSQPTGAPTQPETEPSDDTGGEEEAGSESSGGFDENLDVPPSESLGCRKIDFLFVIDDSESMEDEQQRLIDGFPGFIDGVRETIEEFDYHVMVVTPERLPMSYDPCDNRLGAGRVRTGGGEDCGLVEGYLGGQRYIDASNEDPVGTFACVADVGIDGNGDEKTIWSLSEAITTQAEPGMCNDGFLRDDALLVVTIITDEEDSPDDEPPIGDYDDNSPGDPQAWRDGLVDVKGGDDEAVVVLALAGDSDLDDGICEPFVYPDGTGAEPAPRIRELAESLPFGSWTSVCQEDYADFFNAAIDDIDTACSGFTPG